METAGEIVSNVSRFYLNVTRTLQAKDPNLRDRTRYSLSQIMKRAWSLAALPQRQNSGTVSIAATTGVGDLPADFSNFGPQSSCILTTGGQWPLKYWDTQAAGFNATMWPSTGRPLFYTRIKNRASGETAQMQIWPPPNVTSSVTVNMYNAKCLDPVDFPPTPTAAAGATGALTGSYKWKATYVWSAGQTEGGFESAAVALATQDGSVQIPMSASRQVTGANIYRTLNGGNVFRLSGAVDSTDIVWVSGLPVYAYTDAVLDTDLGALCPMPGDTGVLTGIEQFPNDFIESVLFEGTRTLAMSSQGDLRDAGYWTEWKREVKRMWADQKPGQPEGKRMVQFGENRGNGMYLDPRWRYPQ